MRLNFNSPQFLNLVIKYGLLAPSANDVQVLLLHGVLLRDSLLLRHRLRFGLKWDKILAELTPDELAALRERVTGLTK